MSQEGQKDDPMIVWIIGLGLVALALFLMWKYFHTPIATAVTWLRWAELTIIEPVIPGQEGVRLARVREYLRTVDPSTLTLDDLIAMSRAVGLHLRYVVGVLLLILAIWAAKFSSASKWRKRHDLESFIKVQSLTWRVIKPILKVNPADNTRIPGSSLPAQLEPWAEALWPEEWVAYFCVDFKDGKIDAARASEMFAKQLCGHWRGVSNLPDYAKGLVVAFALKALRKRAESREFLGDLAEIWTPNEGITLPATVPWWGGEWVLRKIEAMGPWLGLGDASRRMAMRIRTKRKLDAYLADEKVQQVVSSQMDKHAFVATAMLGLLAYARERGGVLASSEFLWLRPTNRLLWYPLNALGGQTFYTEASGAMAHYQAELAEGRPVKTPMLDAAVEALERYLNQRKPKIPGKMGAK